MSPSKVTDRDIFFVRHASRSQKRGELLEGKRRFNRPLHAADLTRAHTLNANQNAETPVRGENNQLS